MIVADFSQVDALAVTLAAAGAAVKIASTGIVAEEADQIRADAQTRSPVLTGALAAGWYVTDGGMGAKIVTNDTRQAFYQEFGTSRHGPQPSLFPAAEQGVDRMTTKIVAIADPL